MPRRSWKPRGGSNLWSKLKPIARGMRKKPTPAEDLLRQALRDGKLGGFKFRRQHPIDEFLIDLCCPERWLVIEVDGGIHTLQREKDAARQAHLELMGYRVIRFPNDHGMKNLSTVTRAIWVELHRELPGPDVEAKP